MSGLSIFIGQARERQLDVDIQDFLERALHVALDQTQDVFHLDEGHLEVDLGELRLAVRAKVFVAEAAGDLHVAVKTGDHGELLVELGALGQRVEFTVVEAARNEEVPGAFRCGLDEHRGLDLDEPVLIEVVSRDLRQLVTKEDVLLQFRTTEVEVPVLESREFGRVAVVDDLEGRGLGLAEDPQVGDGDFDVAGGKVRVLGASLLDDALRHQDELGADGLRFLEDVSVRLIPERELDDARPVAKVDEDELSEVAALGRPAADDDFCSDEVFPHVVAVLRAFQSVHSVHVVFPPKSALRSTLARSPSLVLSSA